MPQHFVDRLQVVIPSLQRVLVTLRQQAVDIEAALAAAQAMAASLRPGAPSLDSRGRTASLHVAVMRTSHTLAELAHLSSISERRLTDLIAGAQPTEAERGVLTTLLPDWKPIHDGGTR